MAEATQLLTDKGLKLAVGPAETSDTVGRGSAIRQTPEAGTEADQGSTVTVVFSSGRSAFPVPDVIGKSENAARKALEGTAGNFKVKDATVKQDSAEKEGTVLAVSPDPNGQYPCGPGVHADGVQRQGAGRRPGRRHRPGRRREPTLKKLGFRVGYATGEDPNAVEGTVLKQSVKAGNKAPKGTLITLTVNNCRRTRRRRRPRRPTPRRRPDTPPITIGG